MRHPVYLISLLLALSILLVGGRGMARHGAGYDTEGAVGYKGQPASTRRAETTRLFMRLKLAKNAAQGRAVEVELRRTWSRSGSTHIDNLMGQAQLLARQGYLKPALALLDRVVYECPEFIDGWNRRANVFYLMRRYGEALQAIKRVLALEPRHFGALTGKAFIEIYRGRWQDALDSLRRAVEIHPFLHERYLLRILEKKLHWRRL